MLECWFKIICGNFKVDCADISQFSLSTDKCVVCKYSIISLSFQQIHCGSRYCKDCYDKLSTKYYCSICKVEDSNNLVHKKENIFADKALRKDLQRILVTCPDCDSKITLFNLEDHALNKCESRWNICSNCQRMYKIRLHHSCFEITDQIQTCSKYELCSKCGEKYQNNEKHNCTIAHGNICVYGCIMELETNESHRSKCSLDHLDRIWGLIKELRMTECKKNEKSKKYTDWFDSSVDKIKLVLKYEAKDVQSLKDEISLLKNEMNSENKICEIIKGNLLKQLSEIHNTSFDGTTIWRIDNFNEFQNIATKRLQTSIFSSPFYTSKFGYKLCLQLYPNGDSTVKGVAMSLFLVIMQGNYDAMLRWPFKQRVKFILIDHELKNNHFYEFHPQETMDNFWKPKTNMNVPAGISKFITFSEMKQLQYLKNNTIFIKCIVDCSNLHE